MHDLFCNIFHFFIDHNPNLTPAKNVYLQAIKKHLNEKNITRFGICGITNKIFMS